MRSGDKVFVKVSGHQYWPAEIVGTTSKDDEPEPMFKVFLFGVHKHETFSFNKLFSYEQYKSQFGIPNRRRKNFNKALREVATSNRKECLSTVLGREAGKNEVAESEDIADQGLVSRSGRKIKVKTFQDEICESQLRFLNNAECLDKRKDKLPLKTTFTKTGFGNMGVCQTELEKLHTNDESQCSNTVSHGNDHSYSIKANIRQKTSRKPSKKHLLHMKVATSAGDILCFEIDTRNRNRNLTKNHFKSMMPKIKQKIKHIIHKGLPFPGELQKKVDKAYGMSKPLVEERKKKIFEMKLRQHKEIEVMSEMAQCDILIKSGLNIDKPNTDICKLGLDKLIDLPISGLMLKKLPYIVQTVNLVLNYRGNIFNWAMTDADRVNFIHQRNDVVRKAHVVWLKFKKLLNYTGDDCWERFYKDAEDFRTATKFKSSFSRCLILNEPEIKKRRI